MTARTELSELAQRMTTPYALVVGLGVLSSTTFLFANLGIALLGLTPATNPAMRKKLGMSTGQAVEQFAHMLETIGPYMATSSIITTLSLSLAPFLYRPGLNPVGALAASNGGTEAIRYLNWMAAVGAVSILPYTMRNLIPINKVIAARRDKLASTRTSSTSASSASTLSRAEERESLELMGRWARHHRVRMAIGGLVWALVLGSYRAV